MINQFEYTIHLPAARTICKRLLMPCWIYFNLELRSQHFQYLHIYEFILYQVINGYFQVDLVIFTPWKEVILGKVEMYCIQLEYY